MGVTTKVASVAPAANPQQNEEVLDLLYELNSQCTVNTLFLKNW